jgi:hypothetical protein
VVVFTSQFRVIGFSKFMIGSYHDSSSSIPLLLFDLYFSSHLMSTGDVEIQNLPEDKILNEENNESQSGPSAGKKRKVVAKKRVSAKKKRTEESLESQPEEQVQTLPALTAGYVGFCC